MGVNVHHDLLIDLKRAIKKERDDSKRIVTTKDISIDEKEFLKGQIIMANWVVKLITMDYPTDKLPEKSIQCQATKGVMNRVMGENNASKRTASHRSTG